MSDDEVHGKTIRRTTKLELGLVVARIINVAAVVAFAVTMATKVDTVIENMARLSADVRILSSGAAEAAVLRYRMADHQRRPDYI
jgi:hypothetical protein